MAKKEKVEKQPARLDTAEDSSTTALLRQKSQVSRPRDLFRDWAQHSLS